MSKNLVIVESPAKAKTIAKFLGKDFDVVSCMGHVVDLPAKKLGVDIENNFKVDFVVIPGRKKVLDGLKKQAKETDTVYFATDPDREGEAIGWHLKEKILGKGKPFKRVEFHEITQRAIQQAFGSPREFNTNKIQAQLARRVLDRIVGYFLSPLLWRKIARGLSAGRVQSVALRLVVEREREIQKFVPQEFWKVTAELEKKDAANKADKKSFLALLEKIDDKKNEIAKKEDADSLVERIQGKPFVVTDIQVQKKNKYAPAPFITSTLQQDAFNKLGFSTSKTMVVAQELYEGVELGGEGAVGLITYMRTDSTQIAQVALKELREFIEKKFGKEYLPEKANVFKSKSSAQEAHEAIRPTDFSHDPSVIKDYLSADQHKLYDLIWKRAVASQMNPVEYESTVADIKVENCLFRARGSKILFDGFGTVYSIELDEEKSYLPPLSIGEELTLLGIQATQHFTKPPARYSEGSLVKALEEDGVGRPSTYAPTIKTIIFRNYVKRLKGYLSPTELGFKVNDFLVEHFPTVVEIAFTARMEEELDRVEEGTYNWVNVLNEFYPPFKEKLDFAAVNAKKEIVYTDETCDLCGKKLVVKWGRRGKFLSCSDYPTCKFSKPITTDKDCPLPGCGGKLIERRSGKGRTFYGCSKFPACRFTASKLPE